MIGDAEPIRFSSRIGRKASSSPIKGFLKNETRKSAVRKRRSVLKTKEKTKVGRKKKSEEISKRSLILDSSLLKAITKLDKNNKFKGNSRQIPLRGSLPETTEKSKVVRKSEKKFKQVSSVDSPLPRVAEKAKIGSRSKLKKISKQTSKISKQASVKLDSKKTIPKRFGLKQETKNSLINKISFQNPGLLDERKKSIDNVNLLELTGYKKHCIRRSLRISKYSLSSEKKELSKELNEQKLVSLEEKRSNKKKCSLPTTNLISEPVLVPNTRKSSQSSSDSIKKYLKVLIEPLNQEVALCTPFPKTRSVSLNPEKVSCSSKNSDTRKSGKRSNQSRILNSEISLSSSSFQSILETPHPEKHSEKRKSSRLLGSSSLIEEIPLFTPVSKTYSVSSNPEKVSCTSKSSVIRKSGKRSIQSRMLNSEISLSSSTFQSILETPLPEKHLEKRKSSRLLGSSPLKMLNRELPLCTPTSAPKKNPHSGIKMNSGSSLGGINKSSKSSKKSELLVSSESLQKKQGRSCKLSNKEIATGSSGKSKRNSKQKGAQYKKASEEIFKMPLSDKTENLPLDIISTPDFAPLHARTITKKYLSKLDPKSTKRNFPGSLTENHVSSKEIQDNKRRKSADISNLPSKGTLKHKRWLLNNLKEKNSGYEDDIFENQNFSFSRPSFHFGDESDGSSVNIATPKFECILTPALPKKTPRFKDCISQTELMQARKTAEEYLYRRNKKRKSGDKPSSSGKNTSINKMNTTRDLPEKKKLDFDEAVNKLIEVQKDLQKEAEIDDEAEDIYFSDASN